jgi:hypothetical protein
MASREGILDPTWWKGLLLLDCGYRTLLMSDFEYNIRVSHAPILLKRFWYIIRQNAVKP